MLVEKQEDKIRKCDNVGIQMFYFMNTCHPLLKQGLISLKGIKLFEYDN